jgi:transcriptional regulator with XRE-family HTH domain/tetratricopeptide (TPR) repeat protein
MPFDGNKLRQLRLARGYSQDDLANLARVSAKTVRDAESGKRIPRGYIQRALAKALNCALEAFQSQPAMPPAPDEAFARSQLPVPPRRFVGREKDLERLAAAMRDGGRVVIEGTGGVGKTTLASVFAWNASPHYPGGTIVVDLQGGSDPLPAERAMRQVLWWLRSGPVIVDSRFDLHGTYHGLLREKRVLLVLDNAADAAQVAPLIPLAPSAVIVTARQSLASLDLTPLVLEPLARGASIELLRSCSCPMDHAERLASVCGDLPLTLTIVAREAARPDCDVREFTEELEREQSRLVTLDAISPAGQISGSLQRSIATVEPELRRALALLQVFPQDFDRFAAAKVWSVEPRRAIAMVRELSSRHLIQYCSGRGQEARYRVHDLVRIAAATNASDAEVVDARFRHAQHYVTLLRPFDPLAPDAGDEVAQLSGRIQTDAANLYAALRWCILRAPHCAQTAMLLPRVHRAWALKVMLAPTVQEDGPRSVIQDASDGRGHMWMPHLWLQLGDLCRFEGDYETATRALERAVREIPALGNPHLDLLAGITLGVTYLHQGDLDRALSVTRPYLPLARQHRNALWESYALLVLGLVFFGWDHRKCEALLGASLAAGAKQGNPQVRSEAKCGLASSLARRGELRHAYALASEALEDVRNAETVLASRAREASALKTLALVCLHFDLAAAVRHADEALQLIGSDAPGSARVGALHARAAVAFASPSWIDAGPFVEEALKIDALLQPYAPRRGMRELAVQYMIRAQRLEEAAVLLESLISSDPPGKIRARKDCGVRFSLAAVLEAQGHHVAARDQIAAAQQCISRFRLHVNPELFAWRGEILALLATADAA